MRAAKVIPESKSVGFSQRMDPASQFIQYFARGTVIDRAVFTAGPIATQVRLKRTDKYPEHELHTMWLSAES